ncbi:RAB6A-GEF complex partner protein 1 [Selaginella moellendorffii]|uniref:RAB6A-GEF complex partner protein 1 n=1 Tax=Selaginella moellendorffii TaxID=88036 RepID=UPI000D1C9555|nr:RAB6A-GEF complex partner protein 1 [Selaginella moellendorffii]|eukprot:XP_024532297.1 RAB6A-GEF complex partner protein 1 [Selaginella moellendorffii]
MMMAYGWPRLFPLSASSRQFVIYLKVLEDLLLVVTKSEIEIWSFAQHRIKLGHCVREASSLDKEGPNAFAVWKADGKSLAVITAGFFFSVYEIAISGKKLADANHAVDLLHFKCGFNTRLSQRVTALTSDDASILLGLSDGSLAVMSWTGEEVGNVKLRGGFVPLVGILPLSVENGNLEASGLGVVQLETSTVLQMLVVVFMDGRVLQCSIDRRSPADIKPEKWASIFDAVCTSIGQQLQLLAVGSRRGTVELLNLADNLSHIRTISLLDWGYSVEDTGSVASMSWTPDNSSLAVGWKNRGISVWSVSGCRLMCSIRQGSVSNAFSPASSGVDASRHEPLANGAAHLAWGPHGFSLIAAGPRNVKGLLEFSFAKSSLKRCVSGSSHILDVLYGEDRLLLVEFDEEDELKLRHLMIPKTYISEGWPVRHVAINEDGSYLAIAGKQGVILYDVLMKRWRVFGDITQERQIRCFQLIWLDKIIVLLNYREATDSYELSLYPRFHLDESSLLCRKMLPGNPITMDIWQQYILVAFAPFDLRIFRVTMDGNVTPFKVPVVQLDTVRELSIVSVKRAPVALQLVPPQRSPESSQQPGRCVVLRNDGELSILDLDKGSERSLATGIERYWLTSGNAHIKGLAEEISWWAYGHQGMQVWYPSSLSADKTSQLDPEIGFDREVYPLALCPSAGVLVGVSQRLSVSTCSEMPCFEPIPQAETILPCLLHHLLQRNKQDEALQLAKLSARNPHFSHSLEWLLFRVFDGAIFRQNPKSNLEVSTKKTSLLEQVCELIRNFPEYPDVVVSVARKTDGRHWPLLFAAAGDSTKLFEECFERKSYHTATCYILVIAKLEGPSVSQRGALRLLQATLDEFMYELAGELVQFLLRIGREYENSDKELGRSNSNTLTTFFLRLPSSTRRASLSETDLLTSTVRKILEDHAGGLMSRRALSDLVAFVKETQFNLTKFLQAERDKSARLDDFASALRSMSEKLCMDVLQNRLDAEFLLAHMCTVGFREWIVVLSTLLRRVELLVEIFRGDVRLWQAYSRTLKSHRDFVEYQDLLVELESSLA